MLNPFFTLFNTNKFLSGTPIRMMNIEDFSTWSFFMFSFFIVFCLVGTFSIKATPVHRVVSLLFLSIITVLFWISATHFLFVYIVYIMAFIGAVLMLFLSVVLMLPISAISQINFCFIFFVAPTLRPEGVIFPELKTSQLVWVIIFIGCFFICSKLLRMSKEFPTVDSVFSVYNKIRLDYAIWVYKEILINCKWHDVDGKIIFVGHGYLHNFFYSFFPLIETRNEIKKLNWKFYCDPFFTEKLLNFQNFNAITFFPTDNSRNYWYSTYGPNLNYQFPFVFFSPYHPSMRKLAKFFPFLTSTFIFRLCWPLNYFYFMAAKWGFMFYARTHTLEMKKKFRPATKFLNSELVLLKFYFNAKRDSFRKILREGVQRTLFLAFTQAFLEIYFQVWMVVTFLVLLVPSIYLYFLENKDIFSGKELTEEVVGGLGNIKELLYEHYNLLLILSTIVLLVALLGAAIMTRNKR